MFNSANHNRRVVVTGLGVISSLGIGWQEFWKNLLAGKSGISRIESFDTSSYDRHLGGEVKNFDPTKFMSRKKAERLGRTTQMIISASKLALKDANMHLKELRTKEVLISIGTTLGERRLMEIVNRDILKVKRINHFLQRLNACRTENLSNNLGVELGLKGCTNVLATACASGNYAIGQGFDFIRNGKFDYALVGGADSFSLMAFTGFNRLYAIAPEKCQPFDKNRQGMIPGEGAGMLLLELLGTAKKRRAPIYAEILGYGMSCDAYNMTEPAVIGITKALQKALKNSCVKADQVDYISAHGTGTIENDAAESQAINRVFGKRTPKMPASSIKSMLGHTMGAASAFGAISCCLAIKDGKIPPTINHESDDPDCGIDCVPNKSRSKRMRIVLNNSQAFGGNNACLILASVLNG